MSKKKFKLKSRIENTDIVIFGNKKVSVGIVDVDTGVCTGSCVDTDPQVVERYIREFDSVTNISHKLNEIFRE